MAPPTFPSLYQTGGSTLSGGAFPTAKHVDYGPQSAFGKQPDSRSRSLPSFVFGRTDRLDGTRPFFDEAHTRDYLQAHEAAGVDKFTRPAPGHYGAAELPWKALGRSGRSHAFGKPPAPARPERSPSRAFGVDVDRLPGSGANYSTFGPQRVHENHPFRLPKFERVLTRERNDARRYLGREYDARAWLAPDSPASTATAVIVPSVGKQAQSTRRNAPSFGFGTSPRFANLDARESPRADPDSASRGPGKYHETEDFRATLRRARRAGGRATYWTRALPAEGTTRQRLYPNSSKELRKTHARAEAGDLGDGTKRRLWA